MLLGQKTSRFSFPINAFSAFGKVSSDQLSQLGRLLHLRHRFRLHIRHDAVAMHFGHLLEPLQKDLLVAVNVFIGAIWAHIALNELENTWAIEK